MVAPAAPFPAPPAGAGEAPAADGENKERFPPLPLLLLPPPALLQLLLLPAAPLRPNTPLLAYAKAGREGRAATFVAAEKPSAFHCCCCCCWPCFPILFLSNCCCCRSCCRLFFGSICSSSTCCRCRCCCTCAIRRRSASASLALLCSLLAALIAPSVSLASARV